jgi:3-methyladenine DNA glycosylase AlkD
LQKKSERTSPWLMLSIQIVDLKAITGEKLDNLTRDIETTMENQKEQGQICDWLLSNVILKNPALSKHVSHWMDETSIIRQRIFWAYRSRTIQKGDTELNQGLMERIEQTIGHAHPMVQWTMNLYAGFLGTEDPELRQRCIALGEKTGLYIDFPVSKGCTSPYLPIWINSVVGKRTK